MTTRAAQDIYDTDAVVRVHGVAMGPVPPSFQPYVLGRQIVGIVMRQER